MNDLQLEESEAYYNQGLANTENGNVELAIKDYTKAIEINPELVEAYISRGIAYSKKGEIELAIEDYSMAIKLNPEESDAYYYRSKAWLKLGEKENAKSDMKTGSRIGIDSRTASREILREYERAWETLGKI